MKYLVQFRKAIDEQKRTSASLARLLAEQEGLTRVDTPRGLVELVGQTEADELIKQQQRIHDIRRRLYAGQVAALERGATLASTELEGLTQQNDKLNEQLRARREYRGKLQDLLTRGVIPVVRGLEEDIKLTDLEEKITNIRVGVARVHGALASIQREQVSITLDREVTVKTEIAKLQRESAQLEIQIQTAKKFHQEVQDESERFADGGKVRTPIFQIIRKIGQQLSTIPADRLTALKAGDVLDVSQGQLSAP